MSNQEAAALGGVVRRLRDARGWTQDDLVRATGDRVSRSTIQNLEGGIRLTRVRLLRAIAEAFDLDVPALRQLAELEIAPPAEPEPPAVPDSHLSDKAQVAKLLAMPEDAAQATLLAMARQRPGERTIRIASSYYSAKRDVSKSSGRVSKSS